MSETLNNKKREEKDFIDVLAVLIKRKRIILLVVVFVIIVSILYLAFLSNSEYRAVINITSPQEYEVVQNGQLFPKYPSIDTLLYNIEKNLSLKMSKEDTNEQYLYKINTTSEIKATVQKIDTEKQLINMQIRTEFVKGLNIIITGEKEKIIELIPHFYNPYMEFTKATDKKNKKMLVITQDSIEENVIQKNEMIKNLSQMLNKNLTQDLHGRSENAILYLINTLISDVTEISIIKEVNNTLILNRGSFIIGVGRLKKIIENKRDLTNLDSYINPVKSRKKKLVPVILSVFLSVFFGIFLAFIVEFFSRKDVKMRLQEINKK